MTLSKLTLAAMALTLAACTNPARFGNDNGGYGANGQAGYGNGQITSQGLGGVNDPSSVEYFNQAVGDRVLFAVDQSTISPEGRAILDGQARWLNANADYIAVIEGHADEQGTREYNLALGARRANAAREYLISQGVAGNRLRTVSYGKERPIEVCSTEECYNKNRRAVTVLASTLGS